MRFEIKDDVLYFDGRMLVDLKRVSEAENAALRRLVELHEKLEATTDPAAVALVLHAAAEISQTIAAKSTEQ